MCVWIQEVNSEPTTAPQLYIKEMQISRVPFNSL